MIWNKAKLLKINNHPDIRGTHKKIFGNVPENLNVNNFSISEIFMTENNKNVIRGMHFQKDLPQPKIITVITGKALVKVLNCNMLDVKNYGKSYTFKLNPEDNVRLYVPGDWALGYRIIEDKTRVLYLASEDFNPDGDNGIDPFDKKLDLKWGITKDKAILSERDKTLQTFKNFTINEISEYNFSEGDKNEILSNWS